MTVLVTTLVLLLLINLDLDLDLDHSESNARNCDVVRSVWCLWTSEFREGWWTVDGGLGSADSQWYFIQSTPTSKQRRQRPSITDAGQYFNTVTGN